MLNASQLVPSMSSGVVPMLYLGDGKIQTSVVFGKTADIGTFKPQYVKKKLFM